MIDFIQGETKRIMYGCMERHAKKHNLNIENVQLVLGLNGGQNTYTVCENYAPKLGMSFLEVMGVRVDIRGYGHIAPPFIKKSIERFSETYGIELNKTIVMCVASKNEKGKPDVLLFVYNDMNYVDTITFHELFREEDIELPKV